MGMEVHGRGQEAADALPHMPRGNRDDAARFDLDHDIPRPAFGQKGGFGVKAHGNLA